MFFCRKQHTFSIACTWDASIGFLHLPQSTWLFEFPSTLLPAIGRLEGGMGGTAGDGGSSIAGEAGEAAEGEADLRSGAGEREGEEEEDEEEPEKG